MDHHQFQQQLLLHQCQFQQLLHITNHVVQQYAWNTLSWRLKKHSYCFKSSLHPYKFRYSAVTDFSYYCFIPVNHTTPTRQMYHSILVHLWLLPLHPDSKVATVLWNLGCHGQMMGWCASLKVGLLSIRFTTCLLLLTNVSGYSHIVSKRGYLDKQPVPAVVAVVTAAVSFGVGVVWFNGTTLNCGARPSNKTSWYPCLHVVHVGFSSLQAQTGTRLCTPSMNPSPTTVGTAGAAGSVPP